MSKGFNIFITLGIIFLVLTSLTILLLLPLELDLLIYQILFLVGFLLSLLSFTIAGFCKDDPDYEDPFFTV